MNAHCRLILPAPSGSPTGVVKPAERADLPRIVVRGQGTRGAVNLLRSLPSAR